MSRFAIGILVLLGASQAFSAAEPAAAPPSPQQIQRLIEALGDADYFSRQKAESDLGKIGFAAIEALTAATEHDDMEIASRASRLLSTIRSNWSVPGEPADVAQWLANYESQDDANREARVVPLANLPENEGVPAVCRILCYERSLLVAKRAALRLLEAKSDEAVTPELAATLQKGLEASRRAPARWVLAWLQTRQDPQALATLWKQLAGEEEALFYRQPGDTSLSIVEGLLQFQIAALRKINRAAEAAESVERLIALRRGDPDELARLLNWLIDQKDWSATRLVEKRCQATIAESADLLYIVAEAQLARGDAAAAEQSAGQALKLNPNADEPSLALHFQAGKGLAERGRFDWATNEWERVIHNAPPHSPAGIAAARLLAELYHDRGKDDRATETLGAIEKIYARQSNLWSLPDLERGDALALGAVRARVDYFDACHWKALGDRTKQRECLEKALATQSYDIEVLIECYQIPDTPADYHAKIRKLIEKRLCELREQAADLGANPAAASPCNEFAWLAANTEGDLDEALQFSKRSLDLLGEQGAYCDTLARVYFAKGDYAEAVRRQTRAAELSPHMLAIQNQLALFRKKAAEKGIKIEEIDKAEKQSAPSKRSMLPNERPAYQDGGPVPFGGLFSDLFR